MASLAGVKKKVIETVKIAKTNIMNATNRQSNIHLDDNTVKISVKCSSEECNALNFFQNGKSNKRYKQKILPILLYLYWFKHENDENQSQNHKDLITYLGNKYDQSQARAVIKSLFEEDGKQKHLNAELSQIKLTYNEKNYQLFHINFASSRRVWEIIACCYEEELLKFIFDKGFTPKQTYLKESFSNINKLKTIKLQSNIIASMLCAFDFNGKKPEVDVIKNTYFQWVIDKLRNYYQLEIYRAPIMSIISGISLVTGSALTLNTFWGPVLLCWRYILKWTDNTYYAFLEFYSHEGKINLDDELEGADTVTNLMFRAFLKDVLLNECYYRGKHKYVDLYKDANLCSIQTKLFRLHYEKFIGFKTKLFHYNLLHLIALNNNEIYKTFLTEKELTELNNETCFNIRNNIEKTALCNFSKNLAKINKEIDKINILNQLGFQIDKGTNLFPDDIFNQKKDIINVIKPKDGEDESFFKEMTEAINKDDGIKQIIKAEKYNLLNDDNIILKF